MVFELNDTKVIILCVFVLSLFALVFLVPIISLLLNDNKKYVTMKRKHKWDYLIKQLEDPYEQEFWNELKRIATKAPPEKLFALTYSGSNSNNIKEYGVSGKYSLFNINEVTAYDVTIYNKFDDEHIFPNDYVSCKLYELLLEYLMDKLKVYNDKLDEEREKIKEKEYHIKVRKSYYKLLNPNYSGTNKGSNND